MNCGKCNKPATREVVYCKGGCGGVFHCKCMGLTDHDVRRITENKFMVVMCEDCQMCSLSKMHKELTEIKKIMVKQENSVSSKGKKESKESYADIVKRNEATIVVKPKGKQDAKNTKSELKTNINTEGIQIASVKARKDGSVVATCENNESSEKLKSKVVEKLNKDYEIKNVESRKPRFKLLNLDDQYEVEKLVRMLLTQNEILKNENISIKAKFKNKHKKFNQFSAIIEVEPSVYDKVMKAGKLSVGWERCQVSEAIYVKRCYKCLGFNHSSKDCTANWACAKCAGNHTKESKCSSEVQCCVNCTNINENLKPEEKLEVNHSAFDWNCPVYQRKLEYVSNISGLYYNIEGLLNNKRELEICIEHAKPDIIILSETHMTPEILDSEMIRKLQFCSLFIKQQAHRRSINICKRWINVRGN